VRPTKLFAVAFLSGLVTLAACSGSGESGQSAPTTTGVPPTTTTTLPPFTSRVAEGVAAEIPVFVGPLAASPSMVLPNPWFVNDDPSLPVKQVLLIEQQLGTWFKVLLPVRPNGSIGWIKANTVRVFTTSYHITVGLGAHQITVFNGTSVVLQQPVAIGAPATPTPTGTYYLRVLLQAPDPNTVYGPFAYPLSGHSEVLTSFDGGDAELGVHGNNDASVLGKSVTHGCIRMDNDGITMLTHLLPLGTPVEIDP
jgi:lipoprotein-anchoring transpeptidase ErfK/SrfK